MPSVESGQPRCWGFATSDSEVQFDGIVTGVPYDIMICASSVNSAHVIFLEDQIFTENTTKEVAVADCVENVEMYAYNPDGSLMVLQKVQDGQIVQDGYGSHSYLRSYIHKDYGQLFVMMGNVFRTRDEDGNITENNIARVHSTRTDKLAVAQIDYAYDPRTGWTTVFNAVDEMKTCKVESNPADYCILKDKYEHSPYEYTNASADPSYDYVNSAGIWMIYSREGYANVTATIAQPNPQEWEICKDIRMCYPPDGIGRHNAFASKIEPEDPYTMMFSTGELLGCFTPLAMNTSDGVRRYPLPSHPDWNAICDETGGSLLPLRDFIAYDEDPGIEYGYQSAPSFDFRMYDYGFANQMFQISYKGMYGEERNIDCLPAEIHFLRDGEELWSDYRDLQDFRYSDLSCENIRSTVDFTIINRNLKVDGLDACNESHLVYDERKADYTPPTLTYLSYRNKDGVITNRFSDAEEGEIVMYAEDYFPKENEDGYTYYFGTEPASVKVEYAVYGGGEWKELPVVNDASKTFNPGFGHYYSGSLADVKDKNGNGWFDLRISLADGSGNSVVQRISPAFRIDALNSVEDISVDSDIYVEGNTVIAPSGAQVFATSGVRTGSENLSSGVYVVRHGNKAVKVIVK